MPKQRLLLGRTVNLRVPPRRFQILFALILTIITVTFIAIPSSKAKLPPKSAASQLSNEIEKTAHLAASIIPYPTIPKLWNPFGNAAHEPPDQENSNDGETRWYSDLQWLNPFSSQITLDEDRAVLPPLAHRTPIYTFYDPGTQKDTKLVDAQNDLLITWRRAWWAKGFRPVVLGQPEAMKHPSYEKFVRIGSLKDEKKLEVARWLAWEHMGGGILANWLALPMGSYEDPALVTLRRNRPVKLLSQGGIITASKENISTALTTLLASSDLSKSTTLLDALPRNTYDTKKSASSIAFYDLRTLASKYKAVNEALTTSQSAGLVALNSLITSHLHTTFLNAYSSGIAVLQPAPKHTTELVSFATKLARILVSCPSDTPISSSCPPNLPHCKPCSEKNTLPITYPGTLENKTDLFTIITVPHPLTFTSLGMWQEQEDITPSLIRRESPRDPWLNTVTATILGINLGGPQRLPLLKEAVASPDGGIASRSLWLIAESRERINFEWLLGFPLPRSTTSDVILEVAVPVESTIPQSSNMARERALLKASAAVLAVKANFKKGAGSTAAGRRRDLVESWSLADAEAWRFVRAYSARLTAERERWEKEERRFAGSVEG